MAGNEHFLFKRESSFGTWAAPDKALPVISSDISPEQPLMVPDETGGGRGQRPGAIGEKGVSGGLEANLRPTVLGHLIRSVFPTRAKTAVVTAGSTTFATTTAYSLEDYVTPITPNGYVYEVTTAGTSAGSEPTWPTTLGATVVSGTVTFTLVGMDGWKNKLLPDDDESFDTFSIQKRYKSDLAESFRGAKINEITIGATTREFATIGIDFVGKDAAISGGTWADGTSAPAVIADPLPYETVFREPFKFYQGVMRIGGTVALTSGELVVTSGTARNDFDNIELTMNFNIATDAYGVNLGDRTVQSLNEGRREITVSFDPNFDQTTNEFYLAWMAGSRAVVELYFQGAEFTPGQNFAMKITLPYVIYSAGGAPELNNEYGLKRHTVEGTAFVDPTTGYDIGVTITTTDDLTA